MDNPTELIYVVQAEFFYEGAWPIRAFSLEEDANKFCDECNLAKENEPEYLSEYGDDDELFAIFDKKMEVWKKNHPSPNNSYADRYGVVAIGWTQ